MSAALRPSFEKGLDILQAAVAAWAVVLCLQGYGSILDNIALAVSLPGLRLLISSSYRRRVASRLRDLWFQCRTFPAERSRIPWCAVGVLLLVPLTALYCGRGSVMASDDSKPVALAASSLVLEGNMELGEYLEVNSKTGRFPYYFKRTQAGIYSDYPSGMVVFALPVALSARLVGAPLDQSEVQKRIEKLTAAAIAVASAGLFFLIALHVVPAGSALIATLFLALGSAMFSTIGQGLWQHDGIIFFSLVILLVEFRSARRAWPFDIWIQGGACAMMLACRLSSALFLVPFGIWVALRSPRRAVAMALILAAFFLPWAALYWSIYGTFFGPSTGQMAARLWTAPGAGLVSVLLSPGRGLLVYQPWIFLAFLILIPLIRRQGITVAADLLPPGWMLFCLGVPLLQLAMVGSWGMWWGGHCWGSRLVCESIPLLGLLSLPAIHAISRNPLGKSFLAALLATSLLLHLPAVYLGTGGWNARHDVDRHPACLWSWSDAPFFAPFRGPDQY